MPGYERLDKYFPLRDDPSAQAALTKFLNVTAPDDGWCMVHEKEALPQSKEGYAKMMQEPTQFVMTLLEPFQISPVCRICAGQDTRTSYQGHVCGRAHHSQLWVKLGRSQDEAGFWQNWQFILGEVKINYKTGELQMRRRRSRIGLNIQKLVELPTEDMWYCVGTEVAVNMLPPEEVDHWSQNYPTTNGGKTRWKAIMRAPAERLVQLLRSHGIEDHRCPVCENGHYLGPDQLAGPRHYQNVYQKPYEQMVDGGAGSLRFQDWDLRNGKLRFDHVCGSIHMMRCNDRDRLHSTVFPVADTIFWEGEVGHAGAPTQSSRPAPCAPPGIPCTAQGFVQFPHQGMSAPPPFTGTSSGAGAAFTGPSTCSHPSFSSQPAPQRKAAPSCLRAGLEANGVPFATSNPSGSAANRDFGSHAEAPPEPAPDNNLPDIPPPSCPNGHTHQQHVVPDELPGAEGRSLMSKMLEECRARTLLQEYVHPVTDNHWWYDLVTGQALFELPDGPHVILKSSHLC